MSEFARALPRAAVQIMNISGSTALVTGANRGLGRAFVQALQDAGCAKIYAAARAAGATRDAVVEPVALDITDERQVSAAAAHCGDVNLLINNAGVARFLPALGAPTMADARLEMETNYFGTLAMCRAFAPVLKRNGGGALVNMLSVVSFFNAPMQGSYCASKAAAWSLTKDVRFELRAQGTLVIGVYAGYIDTNMTANLTVPKSDPADIAARVIDGIERGSEDILADERSIAVYAELRKDERPFDANMQKLWDASVRGRWSNAKSEAERVAIPGFRFACTHMTKSLTMSPSGHSRLSCAGSKLGHVRFAPKATEMLPCRKMTRMGWTGRAPAPNGLEYAGACQKKEHRHASPVHRSRSDHYRNRYG